MSENGEDKKKDSLGDVKEPLLEGVDEGKEVKLHLEKALKEKDEYLDGWKRAKAELINYKKEELQRLIEAVKFSNLEFMKDVVPVLDSFNLALFSLENSGDQKVLTGVKLIKLQLDELLKKYGLTRIEMAAGDKFDSAQAEAIGELESKLSEGSIAEIVENGYVYQGRVVKPARVKLAKARNSK